VWAVVATRRRTRVYRHTRGVREMLMHTESDTPTRKQVATLNAPRLSHTRHKLQARATPGTICAKCQACYAGAPGPAAPRVHTRTSTQTVSCDRGRTSKPKLLDCARPPREAPPSTRKVCPWHQRSQHIAVRRCCLVARMPSRRPLVSAWSTTRAITSECTACTTRAIGSRE